MTGLSTVPACQELTRNMRREAQAKTLIDAVMSCDPDDRVMFLEAIFEGIRTTQPVAAFGRVKDEATSWANSASVRELKVYIAAIYLALPVAERPAFIKYATGAAA